MRRLLPLLALTGAALGIAAAGPSGGLRASCAEAAGEHHVAIVVEHSTGATLTRCVPFAGDSITAEQAMNVSGIEYQTAGYGGGLGAAVCQVDYEPRTYPPGCWTSTSPYWGMYVARAGGGWAVAQRGISSQALQDGDALGWHYQPQSGPGGGPPPSPAGVCAPLAVAPPVAAAPQQQPAAAAAPQPGAAAGSPATPAAADPATTVTPAAGASASPPGPSPSTSSAAASRPAAGGSVNLGVLAGAVAGGALLGLLMLQLFAGRLRP